MDQPANLNDAIPPGNVKVTHVSISTVSLTWEPPAGEVGGYVVTCLYDSETQQETTTKLDRVTFSDLKPGLKYDFQIKTKLKSGGLSQPASSSAYTGCMRTPLAVAEQLLRESTYCSNPFLLHVVFQSGLQRVKVPFREFLLHYGRDDPYYESLLVAESENPTQSLRFIISENIRVSSAAGQ
ncbi:unnamed protein product [Boreogadus saida]